MPLINDFKNLIFLFEKKGEKRSYSILRVDAENYEK